MNNTAEETVQTILRELGLNDRNVEGTHYAYSIRAIAATNVPMHITKYAQKGNPIAFPEKSSTKLFDFLRDIALRGEHGYNTMACTREAVNFVLNVCTQTYDHDETFRAKMYENALLFLKDKFPLRQEHETYHLPQLV